MGLFEKKKKDAERCPICGKEISFFSGLVIADGRICDDCEKMVRGQFNIEEYYGRENWKIVPFPVSWTVKMKKKQKETQDILSYHTQAAGCSDKARAKASGGRQPIEECGRTGL